MNNLQEKKVGDMFCLVKKPSRANVAARVIVGLILAALAIYGLVLLASEYQRVNGVERCYYK